MDSPFFNFFCWKKSLWTQKVLISHSHYGFSYSVCPCLCFFLNSYDRITIQNEMINYSYSEQIIKNHKLTKILLNRTRGTLIERPFQDGRVHFSHTPPWLDRLSHLFPTQYNMDTSFQSPFLEHSTQWPHRFSDLSPIQNNIGTPLEFSFIYLHSKI